MWPLETEKLANFASNADELRPTIKSRVENKVKHSMKEFTYRVKFYQLKLLPVASSQLQNSKWKYTKNVEIFKHLALSQEMYSGT